MNPSSIILLSGLLSISLAAYAEPEFDSGWKRPAGSISYVESNKVVFHLNTLPTSKQLKAMTTSLINMKKELPGLQVKVVSHGEAVPLFKAAKQNVMYKTFLDENRKAGVQFVICNNTLIRKKIKLDELYEVKNEDVAPVGILEIARLQQKGFAYIKLF